MKYWSFFVKQTHCYQIRKMLSLATRTLKLGEIVKFKYSTNVILSNVVRPQLSKILILIYR